MLPHRLQGIGTEYTVAPNSTSGATKILAHWVHLKNVHSSIHDNIILVLIIKRMICFLLFIFHLEIIYELFNDFIIHINSSTIKCFRKFHYKIVFIPSTLRKSMYSPLYIIKEERISL